MIIPGVNLMGGRASQLVEGQKLDGPTADPVDVVRRYALAGEVSVIDVDSAKREGSNTELLQSLLPLGRLRVGGGIRDRQTAVRWLDAGAEKIVVGTAATPELFRSLPRSRLIAALDAHDGQVVVDGWRTHTGRTVVERMAELRAYVGGFLVNVVEKGGKMQGTRLELVQAMVDAAGDARLTVAGGITTAEEIGHLDRMGVDAQVGMALHTGRLDLADAISAPLSSDRLDGLWPSVVADPRGVALGLCWSSLESIRETIRTGSAVFYSRRRGLWKKRAAGMRVISIDPDCDRDTLRFVVVPNEDGFCHRQVWTCFGPDTGIGAAARGPLTPTDIPQSAQRLEAAVDPATTLQAAADLLRGTLAALQQRGLRLEEVEEELNRQAHQVSP